MRSGLMTLVSFAERSPQDGAALMGFYGPVWLQCGICWPLRGRQYPVFGKTNCTGRDSGFWTLGTLETKAILVSLTPSKENLFPAGHLGTQTPRQRAWNFPDRSAIH